MPQISIIRIALIFFCVLALSTSLAGAEVSFSQSLSSAYYNVEGNQNNSFYPAQDADYLHEGFLQYNNILSGDYNLFGKINYRATDDRLIDSKDISLESITLGANSDTAEFLTGDFYSNFSQYSLSNALKGMKLTLGSDKTSRFIFLAGLDTAKWEDLWEERCDNSLTRRSVWGSRLENNFLNNRLALNFNYAGARDDSAFVTTPIMTNILSLDARYELSHFLSFSSEIAQSYADADISKDEQDTKPDRAIKFACNLNFKDYNLISEYSRIGNNFISTGGFLSQDLETIKLDGIKHLPLNMRLSHYIHMDRDNLSDTKATTTKQLNPGARLDFILPKDMSAFISTDLRKRFSSDKNTDEKTYAYSTGLIKDFKTFYSYLNYTKTIVANDAISVQERSADIYSLGLNGGFDFRKVMFSWNVSQSFSYDNYKEVCESDMTNSTNAGLSLTFPTSLTLETRISFSDNNFYLNDTDSNNAQYYFMISRQLKNDLTFNLIYERRDYNFSTNDNNYAENIARANLSYKF